MKTRRLTALTDLERRRRERRLKTALRRPGVWVTGPLTRRKLYPPTNWPTWALAWIALTVLWMPLMRGLAWGVLWVAYATGTSSEPPPAYTAWAP